MYRYNHLLACIRKSLQLVEEALCGRIVMSIEIEATFESILRDEVMFLSKACISGRYGTPNLSPFGPFLSKQIPRQWRQVSYPTTCSLRGYLRDLQRRVTFFRGWSELKEGGAPPQFWLPAFFFPQSFLTTLRQVRARREGVSANRVAFRFLPMTHAEGFRRKETKKYRVERGGEVLSQKELMQKGGLGSAVVTGLHLQCARWDGERHLLGEARPRCDLEKMPPILLWPEVLPGEDEDEDNRGEGSEEEKRRVKRIPELGSSTESESGEEEGFFDCPVYRNEERSGKILATGHSTNFVFHMRLPTEEDEQGSGVEGKKKKGAGHWIRRGVAAIIQLKDE